MKKICLFVVLMFFTMGVASANKVKSHVEVKEYKKGILVIKLDKKAKVEPYVAEELKTNKEVFDETGALMVINAGFFDPRNGKTTSYVTRDKQIIADLKENESLIKNPELVKNMAKISNRTELRVLNCKGKVRYSIEAHHNPVPEVCELIHSVQAGPSLVPYANLEEEFFIVREGKKVIRESASALHKTARTAVGITPDGKLHFVVVTNEAKMTLDELSTLCNALNFYAAMGFDGGGSTSFNYESYNIVSDKDETARELKSFILVN